MFIDAGSPVPNIPSKSCHMWSGRRKNTFGMEMIRNKHIELFFLSDLRVIALCTPFYFCIA